MKTNRKKLRFSPTRLSLTVLRAGIPPVLILLLYIALWPRSLSGIGAVRAIRQCRVMLEYALMSLAILHGGAAAFEYAARQSAKQPPKSH